MGWVFLPEAGWSTIKFHAHQLMPNFYNSGPAVIPIGNPVTLKKCLLQACIGFNASVAGSVGISKGVLTGLSQPTVAISSITCGPSSGLVRLVRQPSPVPSTTGPVPFQTDLVLSHDDGHTESTAFVPVAFPQWIRNRGG